ncbi:MAG: NAD(P)/FAD-dependent oxidoreductase [Bryobacteraceae bacterium]
MSIAAAYGGARLTAFTRDHVVVAGSGIIGASIAYHLAKRGARVTLLERERPAAGTTRNSFAWLNASSKSPRAYYDLNLAGMLGWRRLALEIGPSLPLQWGGGLQWCKPEAVAQESMKKRVAERQSWGYSVEMIDREQFGHLASYATPGEFGSANFADQEGTIDPVLAAETLVAKPRELGAEVVYPCEIKSFQTSSERIKAVQTSSGEIAADTIVLATGNETQRLAQTLGLAVPLKLSKGILAHSRPQKHFLNRVLMPPSAEIKQNLDGRIVTGFNFDDTGDLEPTREVGEEYLKTAAQYLPACRDSKLEYMTLGYRVLPKDNYPIVGRFEKYPNLYVAAMHSGMTMAPIIGQFASLEILDQARVDMLAPYRPERFS